MSFGIFSSRISGCTNSDMIFGKHRDYGRVAFGAQYEYIKRYSFSGIGGSPSTDDNVVYTSVRYYPF